MNIPGSQSKQPRSWQFSLLIVPAHSRACVRGWPGEAGVLALETEVLSIETASEPGVLGKIAERLAEAEVNIEYTYLAGGRETEKGLIILRPSNVEKGRRVLEEL